VFGLDENDGNLVAGLFEQKCVLRNVKNRSSAAGSVCMKNGPPATHIVRIRHTTSDEPNGDQIR
jgi:hypothetical protein